MKSITQQSRTTTQQSRTTLSPVGTTGFYFSRKGAESPKHGQPCTVIEHLGGQLFLRFRNPELGTDSAEQNQFHPNS